MTGLVRYLWRGATGQWDIADMGVFVCGFIFCAIAAGALWATYELGQWRERTKPVEPVPLPTPPAWSTGMPPGTHTIYFN